MRIPFLFFLSIILSLQSCNIFKGKNVPPTTPPIELPPPTSEPTYGIGQANFEYWKHRPMHVQDFQPVNFQVKATDNQGVTKVELHIYEYQLFKDPQGLPSKRKTLSGIWGLAKTWNLDGQIKNVELNFEYTKGFSPNSNVEYIFKVFNANNELTERFAMFDAGTSPWEKDKILLYSTSRKPMTQTINLCFFPDIDFKKDWRNFLNQTEDLIYEGYHNNNMITNHKDKWSFYYTRQEADGYEMLVNPVNESSYPEFMRNGMIAGIDAYGLLHADEYPDRTYFRSSFNFLATNTFTTEIYNYGTAVHETAHAIFRLSDEYDGCACFQTEQGGNVFSKIEDCEAFNEKYKFEDAECNTLKGYNDQLWFMPEKNVLFTTLEACQNFNVKNGFAKDSCQIFIDPNGEWYRAFEGICIMQDDGDRNQNPFQRTCSKVIDNYYAMLENIVASTEPTTLPPTILLPNIYGYEAVVLVEVLQMENQDYDMKVVDIQYGIPSKNILKGRDMSISFQSGMGEMITNVCIDNPSHILFHGANGGSEIETMNHGSCIVAIPFNKDLAKVSMDFETIANQDIAIKGVANPTHKEFDITKSVKEHYLNFLKK